MKKLLLAAMVSMAVTSIPAFAHHPTLDNENIADPDRITDNLEAVESPHLELTFEDTMGSSDDMGSEGTTQSGDAVEDALDRTQGGAQQSTGVAEETSGDAGVDNSDGMYMNQEDIYRPGLAADEALNPAQTETSFRGQVSTPSAKNSDGVIELYEGDQVEIASEVMVDEEDIGKLAECMVVAQVKSKAGKQAVFMLAEEGWQGWNGAMANLSGVECELEENQKMKAYEGEVTPGEYNFYFAYQLENGKIVVKPEPVSFAVK